MKIWSTIIVVILILSIMTVNVFGIAGAAGLAVGGIAVATEIIVSLGISIFVGSSLKEAIQEIASDENMPVRTWVENCLTSFANSTGMGLNAFAQDLCAGLSYTNQGIITWNRDAVNTAYDLINYAISEYGLGDYVSGGTPGFDSQNLQGNYVISEVINPVAFWETCELLGNLSWRNASDRTAFINTILNQSNYQTRMAAVQMPYYSTSISVSGTFRLNIYNQGVGSTVWFNSSSEYTTSALALYLSFVKNSNSDVIEITYFSTNGQYNTASTVTNNGTVSGNVIAYNNLGGLVTGGITDINAWDMPADVNYAWNDIADTLFDFAGSVAGYDALTGAIVDINDLINTWADVILGAVNDVFGLDVVGLDEPIDITLDQDMVDELEDAAQPQYTDDIDDIIDGDIDTPITGTNDEETVDPDRPFEYTGEYTLDLTEFFPFCIPFDLYNMLKLFDGAPVAPSWEWPITVPSLGISETIEVDLSPFDSVASVLRTMEAIAFAVGLCWGTKKLIMGS